MMSGLVLTVVVALAFLYHCDGNANFPSRYCINPQCSGPISNVKSLLSYNSADRSKLSFQSGETFEIYGKPFGEMEDQWIAKINGKMGFIPKAYVREMKIFHKDLTLVPSDSPESHVPDERNKVNPNDRVSDAVSSDKVLSSTDSYEVIEGTTIPVEPLATVTPTTVDAHKDKKTLHIDPTSSYLSKYADGNTLSDVHSEMSPISPTTMVKKPEEGEGSSNVDDLPSESKNSNLVSSLVNIMSDFVSGKDEETFKEHNSQPEAAASEELPSTENPNPNEPNILVKTPDSKGDKTEHSEGANDNKEASVDLNEGDSEEDEDDEGDEDDDDGEEEEDESEDEEPSEEREEPNSQVDSKAERDGEEERTIVHEEKTVEVVESSVSIERSGSADANVKISDVDDSFEHGKEGSPVEMKTSSEVPSLPFENTPPTYSELLVRKDMEPMKDTHHSSADSRTFSTNIVTNSELSNASEEGDSKSLNPEKEESSPTVETYEPYSAGSVNAEGGIFNNNTGTVDEHDGEKLVNSLSLDQDSERRNVGENDLERDNYLNESDTNNSPHEEPAMNDEASALESTLSVSEEKPFLQSSGEAHSREGLDQESSATSAEMSHTQSSTISPHHGGINHEDNVETSTPSGAAHEQATFEESSKQESTEKLNENVDSDQVFVLENSRVENDLFEDKELGEKMKNIDEATENPVTESNLSISEESSGLFSTIFSPLTLGYDYVIDTVFGKSDEIEVISEKVSDVNLLGNSDISENILNQLENQERKQDVQGHTRNGFSPNDHCETNPTDSECGKTTSNWASTAESSSEFQDEKSWIDHGREEYQNPFDINNPSYYGALLFSTAVGGMLVCFFLGKYYMEGKKSDSLLLAKLNALEKKLMVSSTECLILKDKLRNADDSSEMIESLKSEVDKLQNEKTQLEKELEVAAEAGLEMDRMVSQSLSSQQACESLMGSIEQLRLQANQQQEKTSSLENNLVLKTQENETLAQELKIAEEKIAELSSQLKKVEANLIQKEEEHHKEYDELSKLFDNQKKQYEEDLRSKTVEAVMALTKCGSLEASLNETKDALAVKENEIAVLQECLEKIKNSNGEEQVAIQFQDMLDFGKLKAELTSVSKERDHLKEELQGEEEARKLLEDHVKVIKEEVEKLRKSHEAAEREKAEAQTRLEVLSSYFKEKESQLQKELGAQIQKYTDASSIVQHMKSLEEEVENYSKELNHSAPQIVDLMNDEPTLELVDVSAENEGSQNEALKNEILDQERGYKSQMASIEKKARENWLAARQAERKLDESKQEAGQLRNRLTMLSKTTPQSVSQNGDDSKQNISVMDSNGELSASPLHMGLASNSSVDSLFLDPNSSPPLVSGGVRMPPLMPPPPFPPLPPLPPMSPYHHPISPPLPFVPPPPTEGIYPQSFDGHRPPPLGRMSSPPPPPSPSHSPHPHHANSRPGKYASPFQDRKGERKSASPPPDMYRGMPMDDRGHMDDWGRYRTPPPHSTHLPDYPPYPYPHPRQHWEDDSMHPSSSFRPLPSQAEAIRDKKGGKSKDDHPTEMENLEKSNRYGGKQ